MPMAITEDAVAAIFRAVEPYPEELNHLLRERGKAFVETMMSEVERFEGEENPRREAEIIGGL